jgi:hypothetical protein
MPRHWIASTFVLFIALATSGSASAVITFTPITPPTCPSTTGTFAYHWTVGNGLGVFDLPDDLNCSSTPGNPCPHYSNTLNHSRRFFGNRFTSRLETFLSPGGVTENNYDWLRFPNLITSGSVVSNWYQSFDTTSTSLCNNANCGSVRFTSDGSLTYKGFSFDGLRICTTTGPNDTVPELRDNEPGFGFLQGTNDVVTVTFQVPVGMHSAIHVTSIENPVKDVDIYAKCSSAPSGPAAATWSATSTDAADFMDINGCEGGQLFVVIHAFSGSGAFRIDRKDHLKLAGHKTLRVGVNWTPTAQDLTNVTNTLTKVARRIWSTSGGRILLTQFQIWKGVCSPGNVCGGAVCEYCFKTDCAFCGRAGCGGGFPCTSIGCAADTCTGDTLVNGFWANLVIDRPRDNNAASSSPWTKCRWRPRGVDLRPHQAT